MSARPALQMALAPNPSPMTLDGTRTYVVGVERPVVIDPGPDDERHVAAVLARLRGSVPGAILLTHEHADHAGAARALAAATGARVRVGPGARDSSFATDGAAALEDGEELPTDRGLVRTVTTPGHAPEHVCFHWTGDDAPAEGAVFVGDLMLGGADTTLIAPPEGDLAAYLESLGRIEGLAPGILYPAHGPPIDDARAAIARYREHRRHRIEQLRGVLGDRRAVQPSALVDEIYGPELDPGLREQAAGSIAAMLRYLGRDAH